MIYGHFAFQEFFRQYSTENPAGIFGTEVGALFWIAERCRSSFFIRYLVYKVCHAKNKSQRFELYYEDTGGPGEAIIFSHGLLVEHDPVRAAGNCTERALPLHFLRPPGSGSKVPMRRALKSVWIC